MSLKYIAEHFKVPAVRGARVLSHDGPNQRTGTIIGARGTLLRVEFDGDSVSALIHPRRKLDYLPAPVDAQVPAAA